jgi:Ran GTPase-activating protein (RanGAP) involved in mRNA processing and transport
LAKNRDLFEIDLRGNLIEDDAKEWLEQNFFRRKFYI